MLGTLGNQLDFYSRIPKMERVTFDVSMVHFLLMFGYKLFSLYYPLYLISIGLNLIDVGGVYLITYAALAVFSLVVDCYMHRLSPVIVAVFGILGYGIFSSMILLRENIMIFYFAQVILGFSAAAWTISLRLILMESEHVKCEKSFGWFYSMSHYAAVIAPLIGGFVIWKFGFVGVFSLSVIVHAANAIFAYHSLGADMKLMKIKPMKMKKDFSLSRIREKFAAFSQRRSLVVLALSFVFALVLVGLYRAFLVIFLENLSFSREKIIQIVSLSSIVYLPLPFFAVRIMQKIKNIDILRKGILIEGAVAIFFGAFATVLNFVGVLAVIILDSFGTLMADTGKSSILSHRLKDYKEEASTIDTILSTLFPALGSMAGGIMISYVGYGNTFLAAGLIAFILASVSFFTIKKDILQNVRQGDQPN